MKLEAIHSIIRKGGVYVAPGQVFHQPDAGAAKRLIDRGAAREIVEPPALETAQPKPIAPPARVVKRG